MAKIGDSAHTQHGLGVVKEIDSVRGSKQFRVAGKGFDVWVPEVKLHVAKNPWGAPYGLDATVDPGEPYHVNEDNSTTLPWNGTPQYSVDIFRKDQTIQPGDHEIDADDRLHSSDSRTQKNKDDNRPYPGPNPDLFAKDAAVYYGEFDEEPTRPEWGGDEWHEGLPEGPERTFDAGTRPAGLSDRYAYVQPEVDHSNPITAFRQDPDNFIQVYGYNQSSPQDIEYLTNKFASYSDLTDPQDGEPTMKTAAWSDVRQKAQRLRHEGRVHIKDIAPDRIYATVEGDSGTYDTMISKGGSMGGWGGGQSVSNWHCGCEWGRWAFQRRFSYVGRLCSHAYAAYLDMQSQHMKENPSHFTPKRRKSAGVVDKFKTWLKDNDKGAEVASVSDFMHTTHDDLTDDEVQSLYTYCEDNPKTSPERNFDIDYTNNPDDAYKTADILNQRPEHLIPQLQQVETNEGDDAHEWSDVTKDERETTGPDDIVHFSAIAARLHHAVPMPGTPGVNGAPSAPKGDGGGGGGFNWADLLSGPAGLMDATGAGQAIGDWSRSSGPMSPDHYGPSTPKPAVPAAAITPGAPPAENNAGGQFTLPGAQGKPGGGSGTNLHPDSTGAGPKTVSPNNAPAPGVGAPGGPSGGFDPSGGWHKNTDTSAIPGGAAGGAYTVKPGDTLADIAERSGLGKDNYSQITNQGGGKIDNPNLITPGQQLQLGPAGGGDNAAGRMDAPGPKTVGGPELGSGSTAPGTGNTQPVPTPAGGYKAPAAPAPAAPPPVPAPPAGGPNSAVPSPAAAAVGKIPRVSRLHYAENDDDDQRPDTGEASGMLDRLRELSQEGPDYQNMEDRNDEVRDLVEKLQDAGVDASQFVASLHYAVEQTDDVDPEDSNANFLGKSYPNWADEPFQGSGPDPKYWVNDSASYVDKHERPDFEDVDDGEGEIVKFNDSRSKPQQGPGHSGSFDPHQASMLLHGFQPEGDSGYFNPNNPSSSDWEEGSGQPFMDELGRQADDLNPMGGGGGSEEGAEGGAEGDLASTVADNPELLAVASNRNTTPNGGFSLEAFDNGEFSFADTGGSGGELRRASRVGGGPTQQVRVDRGTRGWEKDSRTLEAFAPPEDSFGYNGEVDPSANGDGGSGGADILASFQRSGAAAEIMNGGGSSRPGSSDDFASSPMVQAMLRTAGRKYSEEEMRQLEGESHPLGARNMPTDEDLAGTHYLSM